MFLTMVHLKLMNYIEIAETLASKKVAASRTHSKPTPTYFGTKCDLATPLTTLEVAKISFMLVDFLVRTPLTIIMDLIKDVMDLTAAIIDFSQQQLMLFYEKVVTRVIAISRKIISYCPLFFTYTLITLLTCPNIFNLTKGTRSLNTLFANYFSKKK